MSANNTDADGELRSPERVEGGFLKQNAWLKPFALIQLFFVIALVALDLANDLFVQIQGRFSNVLFGVILALIMLSILTAAIVLVVNAFRHVTNT
ncbi:hypothetical protein [Haloarchaeobius litoreus]|uniref:Uncharacterized protein n=1 Tax=Haloarchaeobius litoreus TaxID=755306 RepID=A0ABD6DI67_9EURY|nr:hypothetical protein [Haloarchaeobius litoreus]